MIIFKKRSLPIWLAFSGLLWFSCSNDPEPNVGIPLTVDLVVNDWRIEQFVKEGEDITDQYTGVRLDLEPSGFIVPRINGFPVQNSPLESIQVWNLDAGGLIITLDISFNGQPDTLFRKLTGFYVANDTSQTRLNLISRNPRTPITLVLSE